jgi:hypothetical protein
MLHRNTSGVLEFVTLYFNIVYDMVVIHVFYRTIILQIWHLRIREKYGMMAFENRVLRKIFGHTWDEITGQWRRLHEELNDLHSSPSIILVTKSRRMRWARNVASMG